MSTRRPSWVLGLSLLALVACGGVPSRAAAPLVADDAPDCARSAAALRADGRYHLIVETYREDCERGDSQCCELLARELADLDVSADRVADILEPVCDEDGPAACLRAAETVAELDSERALSFYERACQDFGRKLEGNPREPALCRQALDRLMSLRAYEAARRVAKALCRVTVETGCATLGELWAEGRGGERDLRAALTFVTRACRAGDRQACTRGKQLVEAVKAEWEADAVAGCEDLPPELREVAMTDGDVRVASFEADGIRFCVMACRMAGEGGGLDALLIGPLVAAGMAQRRAQLSACGDEAAPVPLRWRVDQGRIVDVHADVEEPTKTCIEKTLTDTKAPFAGTCEGVLRLP